MKSQRMFLFCLKFSFSIGKQHSSLAAYSLSVPRSTVQISSLANWGQSRGVVSIKSKFRRSPVVPLSCSKVWLYQLKAENNRKSNRRLGLVAKLKKIFLDLLCFLSHFLFYFLQHCDLVTQILRKKETREKEKTKEENWKVEN